MRRSRVRTVWRRRRTDRYTSQRVRKEKSGASCMRARRDRVHSAAATRMKRLLSPQKATGILLIGCLCVATVAAKRRFGYRVRQNPPYDGAFQYCRGIYQFHPQGDGGNWLTDYPQADVNLPYRFSELKVAPVSRDAHGNYNHVVVGLGE